MDKSAQLWNTWKRSSYSKLAKGVRQDFKLVAQREHYCGVLITFGHCEYRNVMIIFKCAPIKHHIITGTNYSR